MTAPAVIAAPYPGRRALCRLGLVFLIMAAVLATPFLIWGDEFEAVLHRDAVMAWFAENSGIAWLAAIGLLVSDLALPIPNSLVMAALGIYYGPFAGGAVAAAGNCLSGLLGYALCRRFGRPLALRWLTVAELEASESLFTRSGGWAVALSRSLPVLSEVVCCMAGLARMRFSTFLLALVCGSASFGFTVAAIGSAGSDRPVLTLVICALLPVPLWFAVQAGLVRPLSGPRTRVEDA